VDADVITTVIGTAGHIDHGKSALVRALTGIEPDRLPEEQARGITIDLGFAHTRIGRTTIAVVDVPGHERFVRNMLAGAGGIDAVLLVVDARESVKPQTREHFEICRLLGIDRGLIALTKCDLVTAAGRDRAAADIQALVAGSFLDGAPILPVSSVTGEGIEELRRAIAALAGRPRHQHRDNVARLSIDRAFSVRGFGLVVTGTLVSGAVSVGDTLTVLPNGSPVRVRGLQAYGRSVERVTAPERAAVNLAGLDLVDVRRGMTLASMESLPITTRLDARVDLLASPPDMELAHGTRIRIHHGAGEWFARVSIAATRPGAGDWTAVRVGDAGVAINAGDAAYVRLRFEHPVALTRNDRLVLRTASPQATIGGARVLDPQPPPSGVRRAGSLERFRALDAGESPTTLWLRESGAHGLTAGDLVRRGGWGPGESEGYLRDIERAGGAVVVGTRFVDVTTIRRVEARLEQELTAFHRAHPEEAGAARRVLRERAGRAVSDMVFDHVVTGLITRGALTGTDRLARRDHRPQARAEDIQWGRAVEERVREGGLAPPESAAVAEALGAPVADVERVIAGLVRDKRLVRAGTLIFHPAPLAKLKAEIAALRVGHPAGARVTLDVGFFKTKYGLTRKHAIPLLEWLDRERATRRVGNERVVL
jgi:selenocysteine-specific elongation factor